MTDTDQEFIAKVENAHFRTDVDTGTNSNAMMIWNLVRSHFGYPPLKKENLPAFCATHNRYHKIVKEYGCARKLTRNFTN